MERQTLRTRLSAIIRSHGIRALERETSLDRSQLSKFACGHGSLRTEQVDEILAATGHAIIITPIGSPLAPIQRSPGVPRR